MPEVKPKAVIVQDPEAPIEKNILAAAILDIAKGVRHLSSSGLRQGDLVALILERAPSRLGKRQVVDTLEALEQLESDYRPRKK